MGGKGSEDKRGQPVEISKARSSWLYVAGQPVVCDRYMELVALVNAINPAINATTDSLEVGELQKELLWLLYDKGHLKTFPMAIVTWRIWKKFLLRSAVHTALNSMKKLSL